MILMIIYGMNSYDYHSDLTLVFLDLQHDDEAHRSTPPSNANDLRNSIYVNWSG